MKRPTKLITIIVLIIYICKIINNVINTYDNLQLDIDLDLDLGIKIPVKQAVMFVHIPKTGGSTIERAAHDSNGTSKHNWGFFEFCANLKFPKCVKKYKCGGKENTDESPCRLGCMPWHDPDRLQFIHANNSSTKKVTFCVIRHPVQRMFSSFKYNRGRHRKRCSVNDLNQWAQNIMSSELLKNPNYQGCHFTPQTDFPCSKSILFDDLEGQFNDLMNEYEIDLVLNKKSEVKRNSTSCKSRTVRDFNNVTKEMITAYYVNDMVHYNQLLALHSK